MTYDGVISVECINRSSRYVPRQYTMGFSGVVVSVIALVGLACATVGDNALDAGERVVLVAPVLAPPKGSRTHANDRSRQFPILVLLAQENQAPSGREPSAKSLGINPQPIYVQVT